MAAEQEDMAVEQEEETKIVLPEELVPGEIYRIHLNQFGEHRERDSLGTFNEMGLHGNARFYKVYTAYEDGERIRRPTVPEMPMYYSPDLYTFYKSGKTIIKDRVSNALGIPKKELYGYGGSRPIKRRSVRRRRVHRSIKRRNKSVTKSHVR
jgi:hypothetical protein